MNLVEHLFGPLAAVECRRTLTRGRLLLFRVLAALPAWGAALVFVWLWWAFALFEGDYPPADLLNTGIVTVVSIAVAAALILTPPVLAGTLAGEKDRGTLALLLTSRISPWEIVLSKLASRLLPVLMILLGSLPALALIAGFPALSVGRTALLWLLPLAVAFGAAGLTLAVSTVARKGRDALLAVYLLEFALVLGPLFLIGLLSPEKTRWLMTCNPFYGAFAAVIRQEIARLATTLLVWAAIGLVGIAWSGWRLAPIYLRQLDGGSRPGKRRRRAPLTFGDRPMLWKELRLDEGHDRRGLLRWMTWILMGLLLATAAALGAIVWAEVYRPELAARYAAAAFVLRNWTGLSARPLSWLIQWAVGMRAAVTISAERERHTWDILMTTPLEGAEIVVSKILGSLWSMKLLLLTAIVTWGMAAVSGEIEPVEVWNLISRTMVVSAFMAAVGAWASAKAATAARAMTITLAIWLAAAIVVAVAAFMITVLAGIIIGLIYLVADQQHIEPLKSLIDLLSFWQGWNFFRLSLFALATFLTAWICRRNFDALAGRIYVRTYIPPPPNWSPQADASVQGSASPFSAEVAPATAAVVEAPAAPPPVPIDQLPSIPDGPPASADEFPDAGPAGMPAIPVVMPHTPLDDGSDD